MTSIGWKKFNFFDEERRTDAPFPEGVTTACSGIDDDIWLGCSDGLLVCLDKDLAIKVTFPGFKGTVHHVHIAPSPQNKLLALGEDGPEGLRSLVRKIWDRNQSSLVTGAAPPPLATAKVFAASKLPEGTLQVACATITEWPSVAVALGTSTGAVHLYRGDVVMSSGGGSGLGFRSTKPLTAPFGLYIVRGSNTSTTNTTSTTTSTRITAIHGLHFQQDSQYLFAVSSTALAALSVTTGQPVLEDDCGSMGRGCSTLTPQGELVVAGSDAVFYYTVEEGRKAAAAVRGTKHAVVAYRRYIAASLPADEDSATTAITTIGSKGGCVLRVFDVANKVVAASAAVEGSIRWAVATSAGIVAADASGTAILLRQRPLEQRLESLFRSRSFQLALRIAESESAGPKVLSDVHRNFGDFLYAKREYDSAAVQYAATVGTLEPSYVIQRFLDAQRVQNLTTYLEAVHDGGLASADHTTLLLNCYTKLRDVAKIDAFVEMNDEEMNDEQMEKPRGTKKRLSFDPEAAIAVLHAAGYSEHAVHVALTAGLTDAYLSILLQDCKRYDEALQYIRGLGRRAAATALHRFGQLLLEGDSVATTALLMELCLPSQDDMHTNNDPFVANLADFTHLYSDRPGDLRYACVTILAMNPPDNLPSRQTLYHTLLDLYLANGSNSASNSSGNGHGNDEEVLDLLKRGWPPGPQEPAYDVDRALTTCRMHAFHRGLVFLYTNRREYREAAAVYADAKQWSALIEFCEQYGAAATGGDPEIWHDALERLSSPAAGPGADSALKELVTRIEAGGVMPPLAVLPVLAKNPHLKLELVRDYVVRALQAENRAIIADQEEAQRLKESVAKAESAVLQLTSEPVVFQSSRDAQTGAPLELPSVHFLCGHSFNLRTLGDGGGGEGGNGTATSPITTTQQQQQQQQECPLCTSEHRRVRELQRSYRASAADKDAFFRKLKAAPDGFELVAEYFGKGLLNRTSVSTRPLPDSNV